MNLIVNFTPTGVIPTKQMTPHVPISTDEIVDEVLAVKDMITVLHLHARDKNGLPTLDREIYGELIGRIREFAPDLVICVSLSGRAGHVDRTEPLQLEGILKPDMGSLTLSSLNFNRQASVNAPDTIKILAEEMKKKQIAPELEVFDLGMVNYLKYLLSKGLILNPLYVNVILGNVACAQVNPLHLGLILNDLPECLWAGGGIGDSQFAANSMSVAIGGGVRIGLEDNIWYDKARTELATNRKLVERVVRLAEANERKVMSSVEFRKLMNLKGGRGNYGTTNS